jgi:hypothetical protein
MIARLDLAAIADLKKALPRFAHRPVAHLSHLRPEQVVAYWLDEITEELADESSVAFAARGRELIEGLVLYADLPWDTKVVGRRIGLLKHLAAKAEDARSADMLDALLDEAIRYAASRETRMFDVQDSTSPVRRGSRARAAWVPSHGYNPGFRFRFFTHAAGGHQRSETSEWPNDSARDTRGLIGSSCR